MSKNAKNKIEYRGQIKTYRTIQSYRGIIRKNKEKILIKSKKEEKILIKIRITILKTFRLIIGLI